MRIRIHNTAFFKHENKIACPLVKYRYSISVYVTIILPPNKKIEFQAKTHFKEKEYRYLVTTYGT